ncbi:MAG: cell envelope integrity protein CreD, partial [Candidatus Cloacimonetes bacterium]|nr:cell envelope integrity protein CreD [Candidatus Cloacimonadota bacterium]
AVVYKSELSLSGQFSLPSLTDLQYKEAVFLWEKAFLSLGITDLRGINEKVSITLNDNNLTLIPGTMSSAPVNSGVSAQSPLSTDKEVIDFTVSLQLKGSQFVNFVPVGEETVVQLTSEWTTPSFSGSFLPESRIINENGFDAKWKIYYLNRNYPQKWDSEKNYNLLESAFGVRLLPKVDEYQKTERTSKYAILFLSLTFLSFFISELLSDKKVHPFQYLLVGFAILIFYSLLLSLTEYLSFKFAYLIAVFAIVSMITLYTHSIVPEKKITAIISSILIILYGYLYVILQLQDFALLMGNIGLFIILAIVMFITRKIDWYSLSRGEK